MTGEYCLKLGFISDIHLGHRKVTTESIIAGLDEYLPANAKTGDLDALIISGDLFDRILFLPEPAALAVKLWMIRILHMAKKFNVIIRVLEGTKLHDRGQGKLFETLNDVSGIHADCRYVDKVEVEHIESLGIDVLYVPDEWRTDPNDTWMDVKNALKAKGLEKVDYASMHGVFEEQMPSYLRTHCHRSDRYLGIVRKYINIGHHHTSRVIHSRILVNGSFGRLNHGDEEAKGHFRVTVYDRDKNDHDEITFVENKLATIFKTYHIAGQDEATVRSMVEEACKYPQGSHFRFIGEKHSPHLPFLNSIRKQHTEHYWTYEGEDVLTPEHSPIGVIPPRSVIEVRADNVVDIMERRLQAKGLDAKTITAVLNQLEKFK